MNKNLGFLDPKHFIPGIGITRMFDMPLKIYLLNGLANKLVQDQLTKREGQLDDLFDRLLDKVDLKQFIANEMAGAAVDDLVKATAKIGFGELKGIAKEKAKEMIGLGLSEAQSRMKEFAEGKGHKKSYEILERMIAFAYTGSEAPQLKALNFVLERYLDVSKLVHTPINNAKDAVVTTVLGAVTSEFGQTVLGEAFETGRELLGGTIMGAAGAADTVMGFVQGQKYDFVTQHFMKMYECFQILPKLIRRNVAAEVVKATGANDYIEQVSVACHDAIVSALLPKHDGQMIDPKALDKYTQPIDPRELKAAEQVFFNHLEVIAAQLVDQGVELVDQKIGQEAFNNFIKARAFLYKQAGVPLNHNDDEVQEMDELVRIFEKGDAFNFKNALDKCYEILWRDYEKNLGENGRKRVADFFTTEQPELKVVPEGEWGVTTLVKRFANTTVNGIKGGMATVATLAVDLVVPVALGYFLKVYVENPYDQKKEELKAYLPKILGDAHQQLLGHAPIDAEYQDMTPDEALHLIMRAKTCELVHKGNLALVSQVENGLGLDLEQTEKDHGIARRLLTEQGNARRRLPVEATPAGALQVKIV